ncbi:MAG TPA: hypothetical protein VFS46_07670 [Nitrososphaera sp.]|nr:hypothetical protein [Nitrososphaera sp.]
MSESPEVEGNYNNPKGRSNLEKGAEPPLQKADPTEPVQVGADKAKKPSNPKMPPSGNLEHAGQTDNTRSA